MRSTRMLGLAAVAVVMLVAVLPAKAITERADRSDSLYLKLATQSSFAPVGQFSFSTSSGNYLASGSLIGNNWVLTAAHVVDQATALNFSINGHSYNASRWIANPGWDPNNLLNGYDLGLVQLSSAVKGITPATLYTGTSEIGSTATIVGYGMTGTGNTGAIKYDGKKRAGQNVIDTLYAGSGADARLLLTDFDNPKNIRDSSMGSNKPLDLEGMIASGDSGGGLFISSGGQYQLAGVTSFCWGLLDRKPNSDYGDVGGFSRVSAFTSWINSNIFAAPTSTFAQADTGTLALKDTAVTPEPATLALLAVGLGGMLFRRRHSGK